MKTKLNNLNRIANHLFSEPGARYSDLTKMLCREKGKLWHRGMYSRYFSRTSSFCRTEVSYADRLWEKTPCGGWMLTMKGYGYVKQ